MKKLLFLIICIYFTKMDYAQIVLPSMRAPIGSASKTINSIFKGGKGNTTHSSFLVQTNWTGIYTDNIFKGGSGSSNKVSILTQSNCDLVYVNNIFKGGVGSSNNVNVLTQSNCDPVYVNNIFRGGAGSSNNVNVLTQSNCDPVYVNNIFRGGGGSSNSISVLAQSNCDPVYVNNIFKGGGGYSAQSSMLMNIVSNGIVLNLDAGNTQSFNNSGNTWYDLSGSGNNAVFVNTPNFSNENGGIFNLDGNNFATNFQNNISASGNSRTINVWCKPTSNSRMGLAGTRDDQVGFLNGWVLDFTGNGIVRYYHTSVGEASVNAGIVPNSWYMITATYNYAAQTAQIYVNGLLKLTTSLNPDINPPSFNGVILTEDHDAYPNNFIGKYASINIYNRVLSDNEIIFNYNVRKARFGL